MAGIYLHIPFCRQACHYCDFHFSTNTSNRAELIDCMAVEIGLQQDYLKDEPIETIYFGGGTPSLLDPHEIDSLLNTIQKTFTVAAHPEVTLEGNPDDLTLQKLRAIKSTGVNRLSIGIQSFQETVLTFLNRAHSAEAAVRCVPSAREAGFENISIDLIYAIPGMSPEEWALNIQEAIQLKPEHVSAYALTLEDKTVFGRWAAAGRIRAADDDTAAGHLEQLLEALNHAGYEQYEVSNFSLPGFISQHNSNYWRGKPYLGIGPSAHSYNLVSRQFNVRNNHLYVKALKSGSIPFELEELSLKDHINEYLLTTLRTSWGADLNKLKKEFNFDLITTNAKLIHDLVEHKLARIDDNFLKLTPAGRLLADKITTDLFLVS
jgi:oxygen-independent coproporphyrinogen III oxidase